MRIDSHHHLWDYDPGEYPWIPAESSLAQDYTSDDITTVSRAAGISRTVVVQARQTVEETRALLDIAGGENAVAAVVGWVPLAAPNASEVLDRFQDESALRAVRHVVQGEPDGFLDQPGFNAGISLLKSRNLVYDILIFGRQLEETIRFVDRHPEQAFVLDHIAKPTIQAATYDEQWDRGFRELAKRTNVTCKFSALATEVRDSSWTIETFRPYWETALEVFGPERLMFGTDWPVCRLKLEHAEWVDVVETLVEPLSESEKASFWSGTAIRSYGLSPT